MKEILRANTHGEAEVLRAALQAEGIEAVIRGDVTLGIVGGGLSVWVLHDKDEQTATDIMKTLEHGR